MNKMTLGYYLLGSIIGDISGSIYEFHNIRTMACLPEDMKKVITAFDEECQVGKT